MCFILRNEITKTLRCLVNVTLKKICCSYPACPRKEVLLLRPCLPRCFLMGQSLHKVCSNRCFPSLLASVSRSLHWLQPAMTHPAARWLCVSAHVCVGCAHWCVSTSWNSAGVCINNPEGRTKWTRGGSVRSFSASAVSSVPQLTRGLSEYYVTEFGTEVCPPSQSSFWSVIDKEWFIGCMFSLD